MAVRDQATMDVAAALDALWLRPGERGDMAPLASLAAQLQRVFEPASMGVLDRLYPNARLATQRGELEQAAGTPPA